MAEHTRYQQNIIRKYYENRDGIALQRAQELVTELYLSQGKKRQKHWESLRLHLGKLGVKPETVDELVRKDDPRGVATLVERLASQ
jgi:hypothetical protein